MSMWGYRCANVAFNQSTFGRMQMARTARLEIISRRSPVFLHASSQDRSGTCTISIVHIPFQPSKGVDGERSHTPHPPCSTLEPSLALQPLGTKPGCRVEPRYVSPLERISTSTRFNSSSTHGDQEPYSAHRWSTQNDHPLSWWSAYPRLDKITVTQQLLSTNTNITQLGIWT